VQVNQKEVADADQLRSRVEELKSQGRRTIMLLVSGTENKLRFVSLRVEAVPAPEPAPEPAPQ
jgi:hypothetical protein